MSIFQLVKEHPLKFIISIAVSLVLIWFSFKDLEWEPFWLAIQSIKYGYLLLGAILLITSNIFRAVRWRILLLPQKVVKRKQIFEAVMMGYMGNNVLPFKLGEVLRAMVVSKRHGIKISGVGASVVVERGLDIFSFLLLAGIYGAIYPSFETARLLAQLALAAIVLALFFGFWMNRNHDKYFGMIENWAGKMKETGHPKRGEHALALFHGLETIWRMPKPIHVLWQTIVLWALYFSITYLAVLAFGFGLSAGNLLEVAMILMIFTTFSLSVPAAPGYVGTYHYAVIAALALFGIENDAARALAVVLHLMNYLIYTPIGAWYLVKAGLSLDLVADAPVDELNSPRDHIQN
ncbi:MAG: flippase-like domain-containing protein [Candidatus Marinimicrobia bacterium]|nr:flippase-like domain-containing protein [Candidatus Neomarinimicrobiota bacterium]MCF7850678.1 flippase-like domain-containing protein [Candidatus Neomarinimicrobiota bacterium]MCF7904481.1 flippase-like domain-containing protein [Candidatus Neomarinimicrobiota bacterium]